MSINNTINKYKKIASNKYETPFSATEGSTFNPSNGSMKGNPNPNAYTYNNNPPAFNRPIMSDGFGNYVDPAKPVRPVQVGQQGQQPNYSAGFENLVNSSTQNRNYNHNVAGYGTFNPYLNSNLTNLNYYQNLQRQIENNLNGLLTEKYGAGNFNANGGWYQGNALDTWDKNAENQGLATYMKLTTDLQQINQMLADYQAIEQSRQQDTANLGIQQEMIEKYLQEDRRIRGIENSGQAETSGNAIINAYINASNQTRQNAQDNLHEREMAFQNAQYESQMNFDNKIKDLQAQADETTANDLKELISYASTSDDFALLEKNFGDEIKANKHLQYLFEASKSAIGKAEAEDGKLTELYTTLKTKYGVSDEAISNGINASNLSPSSFGKGFNGTGVGGKQDEMINKIAEMAQAGFIPNGTVVDMNYGAGESAYVYYNGVFYKTDFTPTVGWRSSGLNSYTQQGIYQKYEEFKNKYKN